VTYLYHEATDILVKENHKHKKWLACFMALGLLVFLFSKKYSILRNVNIIHGKCV